MFIVLLFSERARNESETGKYVRSLGNLICFSIFFSTLRLSRPRRSVAEYGAGEAITRRAALD